MRVRAPPPAPDDGRAAVAAPEVPNPHEDEPPFRLWIDDQNSAKTPARQRIEIHPEPLDGPCSDG